MFELEPMTHRQRYKSVQCYPIRVEVEYQLMKDDRILKRGTGYTKNMSRTSVWLHSDNLLPAGMTVQLGLSWPVLLENKTPLKLVIFGRTARTEGDCTLVHIASYEFRTRSLLTANRTSLATPAAIRTMSTPA